MIVKMRKYAFMVYHREYDQFLSTLRDLGVVHVQETKSANDNAELQQMLSELKRINGTTRFLKKLNDADDKVTLSPSKNLTKEDGLKLVASITKLQDKQAQLQAVEQSLLKDISYMDFWGDFSYKNISHLQQAGYVVSFFNCPMSKFEPKWEDEFNAVPINHFQAVTYFITVTKKGTVIDIDAEQSKMPEFDLPTLHIRNRQVQDEIKALGEQLKQTASAEYNTFVEFEKQLQDEFNWANVIVQTERQADDKLMFIEGWTTVDQVVPLEKELDKQGCFFQQLEIEETDNVPIKLKNNNFSKLFEPITKMYSFPNYKELDPTAFFAPFFMLFFGLCFGDGGYGILIVLACTILKKKMSAELKPALTLFQYLGGMAIVIGTLTGSFFGIPLGEFQAFASVKDYFLDGDNLMIIAILLGIFHVIFGKTVAAYKIKMQKGTKYSIAPFAWIIVIVALLSVFGLPSLNIQLPEMVENICYGMAAAGLLAVFFYNTPGKNIFLNFGTGLWNAYNIVFGLLGDVLSYIRLFAVGLTGGILGGVFNKLAIEMTENMSIIPHIICMLLILLIGHAINFALAIIGSLVHPLRLIFVEYFKNAEYEGGGKEYIPFKKAI